jgi:DNA-binding PadR family transcriptional regulator
VSERKLRVKVYRLSAPGRKRLVLERSWWSQLLEAMARVLDAERAKSKA